MTLELNKIHQGHNLDLLRQLDSESVDCVVTSPPYWGHRCYKTIQVWGGLARCTHQWGKTLVTKKRGSQEKSTLLGESETQLHQGTHSMNGTFCVHCNAWMGELGQEPTFELYIEHLMMIFKEVYRVLKPHGNCFVNIADTYAGSWGAMSHSLDAQAKAYGTNERSIASYKQSVLAKSLCDIPARFSIAMTSTGWIKRNDIIWWKRNCIPSSADNRFTVDFEYVFFFTKNNKPLWWLNENTLRLSRKKIKSMGVNGAENKDWKWVDCGCKKPECCAKCNGTGKRKRTLWASVDSYFEQQLEEYSSIARTDPVTGLNEVPPGSAPHSSKGKSRAVFYKLGGRNKRTVWDIPTEPNNDAHFAAFPQELARICIEAGCPELVCTECGLPKMKVYQAGDDLPKGGGASIKYAESGQRLSPSSTLLTKTVKEKVPAGYASCNCMSIFTPGTVLDPFSGRGTTLLVSRKLNRSCIAMELNPDYVKISDRNKHKHLGIFQ